MPTPHCHRLFVIVLASNQFTSLLGALEKTVDCKKIARMGYQPDNILNLGGEGAIVEP